MGYVCISVYEATRCVVSPPPAVNYGIGAAEDIHTRKLLITWLAMQARLANLNYLLCRNAFKQ
jgi:hypothetical protein